jgi:hypothetical protein
VCGTVSAIGLTEPERQRWPELRERLREPGHCMALMRGVLGDTEVAVVAAVTPDGTVRTLAIMASPQEIVQEIRLVPATAERTGVDRYGPQPAKIGDYDVQVLTDIAAQGQPRPVAVLTTPWIEQHLLLYARQLWHRR